MKTPKSIKLFLLFSIIALSVVGLPLSFLAMQWYPDFACSNGWYYLDNILLLLSASGLACGLMFLVLYRNEFF
jgi:uncharacterized membrane protein